ncbi:hypothetical protein GQ55_5G186100 [Panicum hallii var. hallii]|uniref:DUF4408 domain-containing protein n=1 Tax=Panicum hallii var. hallii TaxID=1504633 RepID=A0A2T7DHR4_9POAL|nr:hypothetical protein GQ55_5G186100 [Panicum hallii var. hallii]
MDGGGDAFSVAANPWSLVRGYFSPATLFLLLNMVIGSIALTSRSRRRHLDEDHDHHYQYQQHCGDRHQYAPAPLARTSSVMERLRSLGLYRFRSGDFPPEYNHHLPAGADDDSTSGGAREAQAQYARSRSEPAARPPPPRVRRATDKNEEAAEAVVGAAKTTKSSSEVKKLERAPAQAQVRRAPRAPARRAQLAVREEEEDDNAAVSVDARADDFINKFRQQLQLQRLNSLLNYKEMLNRGL